ncbi:MAG: hydroxyacid dehydrogenase [Planctomycetota bacterium]|nr:MAG: hydroxyacid dehydrogenase [Planctomycetota bacterium]
MKVAFFGTKSYDRGAFNDANAAHRHAIHYLEPRLTLDTAPLAGGFEAVCSFVNDHIDAEVVARLKRGGTRLVALRCAGFNHVDLAACRAASIEVVRVPAYSPHAVAEHAVALMLALNRKTHRAYNRVREGNFALDGLAGFDMFGKTAGVIGTGKIGACVVRLLDGFGCRVLAHDVAANPECVAAGARYVQPPELLGECDIITLHCPLLPSTRHIVNAESLARVKRGMMLINTSRGGLLDTRAVIEALKSGQVGYLGIDVYEEEEGMFFEDQSATGIRDDVLARLTTFPNVIVTGHQAFLTVEALANIAATTLANISCFERGEVCENRVAFKD